MTIRFRIDRFVAWSVGGEGGRSFEIVEVRISIRVAVFDCQRGFFILDIHSERE